MAAPSTRSSENPPTPRRKTAAASKGAKTESTTLTRRDWLRGVAAGGASAAIAIAYGDETERVAVERSTLRLQRWDAPGFRVAVLADLHMDSEARLRRAMRALELAMAERPTAILIPGDFVSTNDGRRRDYLTRFCDACGDSRSPVIATLGNHDYWCRRPEDILRIIDASPVQLLRNEIIGIDGVSIAGLDDAIANLHRPQVLRKGRESRSLLTMLHEPDYVTEVPDHVSVLVAGHSHGGQICLPGGRAVHTPFGAKDYVSGFYPKARVPVFVTRGIGTTGPDWRLFCPPQVAVLTIQPA